MLHCEGAQPLGEVASFPLRSQRENALGSRMQQKIQFRLYKLAISATKEMLQRNAWAIQSDLN